MATAEIVQRVISKVEEFYMGDSENSGEQIFNRFAEKHYQLFDGDFEQEGVEQKLEYTVAFNEYQQLFESHIEKIITDCDVSI